MIAYISEDYWSEKPAGAVALVDDWLFGEGGTTLRVTRRAMRQRDKTIIAQMPGVRSSR
jgi:hypothetical protein